MNFQLSLCGLPSLRITFREIWPSLPVDDFVAFVLHRIRQALPQLDVQPSALESLVSQTCLLISDDGTVRRLLCGPPPGLRSQEQLRMSATDVAFRTCGEAFDLLDDGTKDGLLGWLYFAYREQVLECHCKYRDDISGFKRYQNTAEKHRHVEVRGTDLIFGEVLDIKRALVARGAFASVDDIALLVDKSSSMKEGVNISMFPQFDDLPTTSSAALELPNDELLFSVLRGATVATVLVLQREGVTVTIQLGTKRILLPRMPNSSACVADVLHRLQTSFQIAQPQLYLEGREHEGVLQPSERLQHLADASGNVRLATHLPPLPPMASDGTRTIIVSAASANSPDRSRYGAAPVLASARASPARVRSPVRAPPPAMLGCVPASVAAAVDRGQYVRLSGVVQHEDSDVLSGGVHPGLGGVSVLQSSAPRITCRVDFGSTQLSATGSPIVDVILPDDGLPFTGRDMKQFLVSNHIITAAFASPADLSLLHGKREVQDFEDLHMLVAGGALAIPTQQLQSAKILLTCRRNR